MLGIWRTRTAFAWPRASAALLAVVLPSACGGPADLRGQGGACFRASECSAGLVCIARVCTADLTLVDLRRDAGGDAAASGGPQGGHDGAARTDDGAVSDPPPAAEEAGVAQAATDGAGDEADARGE